MSPKKNCTILGFDHKDRCVVCKNPGASWVRNQYDRTCLNAKLPVNASSSTPDSLGYSPCESAAAFSRSCCSSSFGVSGSAGAAIVRQPLARPPPRSLLDP